MGIHAGAGCCRKEHAPLQEFQQDRRESILRSFPREETRFCDSQPRDGYRSRGSMRDYRGMIISRLVVGAAVAMICLCANGRACAADVKAEARIETGAIPGAPPDTPEQAALRAELKGKGYIAYTYSPRRERVAKDGFNVQEKFSVVVVCRTDGGPMVWLRPTGNNNSSCSWGPVPK